jgi:hypothetical protein
LIDHNWSWRRRNGSRSFVLGRIHVACLSVVETTKRRVSLEVVVDVDGRSGLGDEETSLRKLELVNEEDR